MITAKLTPEDIAEYVLNMRKTIGATQIEFAALIGVHLQSIAKYEKAKHLPYRPEEFCKKVRMTVIAVIRSKRAKKGAM